MAARETNIYFVCELEHDGAWKVGVAENPLSRLSTIRVNTPREIALYAAAPATVAIERYVHHVLRRARIQGEWFRPTGRVLALADLFLGVAQCSADMLTGECGPVDAETTLAWAYARAEEAILEAKRRAA